MTVKKAVINAIDCGIAVNKEARVDIGSLTERDITVTASAGNCISTQAAAGKRGMQVDVYGGTYTSSGSDWRICPIYWASHGTLNVYGGSFKNLTSGTGAAGILQKNGSVNIYDGEFSAKDGIKIVVQKDSTEIITEISGGEFTGTRSGIYIDASNATYIGSLTDYSVSISSDEGYPIFNSGSEGSIYAKNNGLGSRTLMTVSGGKFLGEDPSDYVPSYCEVIENEDGTYSVLKRVSGEARIADRYYDTLQSALSDAEEGNIIYLEDNISIESVSINKKVIIDGNNHSIYGRLIINADDVVLKNLTVSIAVPESNPEGYFAITTNNQNLVLNNCNIVRTTENAPAYGMIVSVGTGKLTAKDSSFKAPCVQETVQRYSPSVIHAEGGVDLDNCTIETNGYGLFSQHVTKGSVRNTVFKGINGNPFLGVNSTLFNGIVFDGCTFEMGENSFVLAGNFTIKNSKFDFRTAPDKGAGNAMSVYNENGPICIENNTIIFSKTTQRGINLTWANWASGEHDARKVTIKGNTFIGEKGIAVRVTNVWTNFTNDIAANNTLNDCSVVIEQ